MQVETALETASDDMDFATLLEQSLADNALDRGDLVTGTILSVDSQGLIVDVNWKRDGIVPRRDLERIGIVPDEFEVGEEIDVTVVRLEDADDNLLLSVLQARQRKDWEGAEALMTNDEAWEGTVIDANRGGLIVPFGNLRGFVPASHVVDLPRGLSEEERQSSLLQMIGKSVTAKVIEVNRKRRRLVFSQRDAQREHRESRKQKLLEELQEGEVRTGIVSGLRDFGAFVDLGGADGLIHISELAWHRVNHPREIVNVGDEVEVYILRLDLEGKRIGLSLKRLQENPWTQVDDLYHIGQLVEGVVSRVTDIGAFISLDPGIEALLHSTQFIDSPDPVDPMTQVYQGDHLLMRVISIEADKQRLGLSLKEVTEEEQDRWEEQQLAEEGDEAEEPVDDVVDLLEVDTEDNDEAEEPVVEAVDLLEVEVDDSDETEGSVIEGIEQSEIDAGVADSDSVQLEESADDEAVAGV